MVTQKAAKATGKRNQYWYVRVTQEDKDVVAEIAKDLGMSQAAFIVMAVREHARAYQRFAEGDGPAPAGAESDAAEQ